MNEKQKKSEKIFFQWLTSAVSTEESDEIQESFERTNMLLMRAKVLSCKVTEITSAQEIEKAINKSKKAFVNARSRNSVSKLLQEYLRFLNEQKNGRKCISNIKNNSEGDKQSAFFKWLLDSGSSAQLSSLYQAYIELEEYLRSKTKLLQSAKGLMDIADPVVIHEIYEKLSSTPKFLKIGKTKTKLSVLLLYEQFLGEKKSKALIQQTETNKPLTPIGAKLISRDEDAQLGVVNTQTEIVPRTDERRPDNSTMDQKLLLLLQDQTYDVLRNALVLKGILTFEEFAKINLWVFLNENGLYSIGQRFAVFNQLKTQIEEKEEPEQVYLLKTAKNVYKGSSPSTAFMYYCEYISQRFPLRFRSIIGTKDRSSGVRILSATRLKDDDLQLKNPAVYIDSHLDKNEALRFSKFVCLKCRDTDVPVSLEVNEHDVIEGKTENLPDDQQRSSHSTQIEAKTNNDNDEKINHVSQLQLKVEQAILDKDVDGMTLDQLSAEFPQVTIVALKQIRDNSLKLVEIRDKIIHVEAFVDLDDAADKLHDILEKLMTKNDGYTSATQLYEYARAEIQMFLNDNDVDDERSVYCVAKFLFEKVQWHGVSYKFSGGNHISKAGEGALETKLDVILKYARDNGGFFSYDDLVQYLIRVGIKTGNLRGQMQIGGKPIFFYYSSDDLITSESMCINKKWLTQTKNALHKLFSDSGDHIVLRDINPVWYELLPTLPSYRSWTPLLLQYVLCFYGEELGARTIGSELNQKYDVLHSMIVSSNSEIRTFSDTIVAYLVDNGIEQRKFEAESLRQLLVQGKMIEGNELIFNMQRAIGKDPRFAWDMAGENVIIKV